MSTDSLLTYLQQQGVVTQADATRVQVERSRSPKSEESIIREMGLADDLSIAKAKSAIFNIPFIDLKNLTIAESIIAEVPIENLKKYKTVPFERGENFVKLAMIDPFDIQATQALQRRYPPNTRLQVYITTEESINHVLDRRIGDVMSTEVTQALEDVDVPVQEITEDPNLIDSVDLKNAPVARIVNSIMQYAVTSKSSDVHVEPMENRLRVRFRIHGIMTERLVLPKTLGPAVVSRIKIMSNLKIDEKRVPQDGRFQVKIKNIKVDIRVSVMPTIHGEKVVMRLLESDTSGITLESTGLRGNAYKVFLDALSVTNGIVLVTGPTGSGKTRTLACSLIKVNDPGVNIISLENPVEIRIPGVTQIQINDDVGLTFANGLRSVLRQDPDIVMVGEIRDQETAELAVQASLTGHLVLSTLHTNSAAAAIPRLLDMGIEPFLLASTVRVVAAQRLPRKICTNCIQPFEASPEIIETLLKGLSGIKDFDIVQYINRVVIAKKAKGEEGSAVMKSPEIGPDGKPRVYLYKGVGCDRCGGSGYSGRIGIFEVLDVSEKISRMIMDNVTAQDIENEAKEHGMITMIQDGYLKVLEGITSIEEVLRVSKE
ncbi:MAG: type II secretion system protein E (GspE), type IV pilus assembly protein PilB [candidate division WS6 bacterium GW2011_GWC1_33_20]|uniref:Type II secretion system protein E n=2 Tax=Candidatus Dojkabacteria TaxID=74243 RepID=A0A0G0CWT1_9BACT|nr:MAG: type II secretion system protein E (GspE), type IV pilus assembly protein PilB [candidate division WS6 bacterium GW2011_GWE2_33_157]KKP44388.1 MAG: type II secretion system protein E (GspE), type IV pilus assembly protein PilB [candidate division WS6 bacterium GW2011_GWC1_33_20]KKP46018.1 MAG: type II secretion system protein E (GspE), type IV pilus assembly protein PilB [candidate division WS6 bacterium GW2011_GWF1_33_233]KKP55470.1 MAG: type II secretion system protein E [candidate div